MHKARTVASIVDNVKANGVHEVFGSVESAARNGWYDYFCDETMLKHRTKKFPLSYYIDNSGTHDTPKVSVTVSPGEIMQVDGYMMSADEKEIA